MIRYLIVDDEYVAHDIIRGYCDMLPDMQLSQSCYDAIEALQYLHKGKVDLIFLDLNMPKLKGFDFLKTLTNPPKIIVTTAYSEFAIDGYELNVVDYLLKPFSFERFLTAVNKVINGNIDISSYQVNEKANDPSAQRIFIRGDKKFVQIEKDKVLVIEAAGNYTKLLLNDQVIMTREKFSDMIRRFSEGRLIQVHKSFAVAKRHIKSVEGNRIHIGEHVIPIGKLYKLNVTNLLS